MASHQFHHVFLDACLSSLLCQKSSGIWHIQNTSSQGKDSAWEQPDDLKKHIIKAINVLENQGV